MYLAILVLYLAAVILGCVYLCPKDSPSTRAVVPWVFLIASVANFLLVCWIIIYISGTDEDYVLIKDEEGGMDGNGGGG